MLGPSLCNMKNQRKSIFKLSQNEPDDPKGPENT